LVTVGPVVKDGYPRGEGAVAFPKQIEVVVGQFASFGETCQRLPYHPVDGFGVVVVKLPVPFPSPFVGFPRAWLELA
jgi:hypothetical protein